MVALLRITPAALYRTVRDPEVALSFPAAGPRGVAVTGFAPERRYFDTASTIAAIGRICVLWLSHETRSIGSMPQPVRVALGAASSATAMVRVGVAFDSVAASTMGALIATAWMRKGRAAAGKGCLARDDLLSMAAAAEAGIRTRSTASLGDKTLLEAQVPDAGASMVAWLSAALLKGD